LLPRNEILLQLEPISVLASSIHQVFFIEEVFVADPIEYDEMLCLAGRKRNPEKVSKFTLASNFCNGKAIDCHKFTIHFFTMKATEL
jgi:hypothetical protein